MSLSKQTLRVKCHRMSPQQRRVIIKENIFKTDYEGLAQLCGVTKRTIIRDINRWRQDGGFEESLMDEFVATYPNMKQDFPEKAFDRLCYLLGRTLTRKMEVKEEYTEKVLHVMVSAKLMKDESANPKTADQLRAT